MQPAPSRVATWPAGHAAHVSLAQSASDAGSHTRGTTAVPAAHAQPRGEP